MQTLQDRLPKDLKFLASLRFWAMVFAILTAYANGDLTALEASTAFFSGFLGIGTFDRFAEKIGSTKVQPFYGTKQDFEQ